MEVRNLPASAAPTPAAAPQQAPIEPKKPQDNTAAGQYPHETKAAVGNAYGKVPQDGSAKGEPKQYIEAPASKHEVKTPDGAKAPESGSKGSTDTPKAPAETPKAPADTPKEGADTPKSPADSPKASTDSANASAATNPSPMPVADPKAAPGEPGSTVTDVNGNPVKTANNETLILNQFKQVIPVDANGQPKTDPKGNPYAVDKEGNYLKTVDGRDMVYPLNSGGKLATLDERGELVKNSLDKVYLVNPDGNYAITTDGKYMAYGTKPNDPFVAIADDKVFSDDWGYPYVVDAGGRYMQPEAGKFAVVNSHGKILASDAETGELHRDPNGNAYVLDQNGKYLQPEPGKFAVFNNAHKIVASDGKTGEIFSDANGNAFVFNDNGKYLQPEAGKYAVYNAQTSTTTAIDGAGNPVVDGNGNPYLVGDDGKYAKKADGSYDVYIPPRPGEYAKTPDGAYAKTADGKYYIVYNKNNNGVAVDENLTLAQDKNGNPYAVNDKGEFAKTADGKYPIVYHEKFGGKAVAIDQNGVGQPTIDEGAAKVVKPDGTFAKTVDGKSMVYPWDSGGKMAASTPKGDLVKGPLGQIYLVNPDGNYALTADGKRIAFGERQFGEYVAITHDGKIFTDPQGRPYALTEGGDYMQPEPGKVGVINKYNKFVLTDAKTGNVYQDSNGHAYVLDDSGNYMQPEAGKFSVFNEQTGKIIATDGNGNPVADSDGNPYLVGEDGKYAKNGDGSYAVYVPKVKVSDLTPVNGENKAPAKTSEGLSVYQDKSGKFVGVSHGGLVVEIDQGTRNMVIDPATGAPIVLSDPFADRPRGPDNLNAIDTLATLPQGTERGDPMAIKGTLFKNGVLDKESLYAALGKYDPRDVYDALVNASRYGGWNNVPKGRKYVHPDPEMARVLIAGMIAWHNDNGPYAPMKEGEMPLVAALPGPGRKGFSTWPSEEGGSNAYVRGTPDGMADDPVGMLSVVHHEISHTYTANAFLDVMQADWPFPFNPDRTEVLTDYLTDIWSPSRAGEGYDYNPEMKMMDSLVRDLGGGDLHAGVDMLKRAYFMGDPVAIKLLFAAVKKKTG